MMLRRIALAVEVSIFVLTCAEAGAGQGFQGGLRGAIRDAGGGVPGAAVTLTNEDTNLARATFSNAQGEYAFAAVEPGSYRVKVTMAGFKTIERSAVRIGTQSFLVLDLGLEVGSLQESITVSGQTPLIETANASHGTVLDRAMLETLPAPGRAAFLMAVSIPTVIASGDGQFNRQQDQSNASFLSLGGGPRRGNNYTIDGVAITDILNRAVANPTMEALDDVKVQVHTYDAEMGRTGGGVFNTTMRSGTNTLRGTGFFQTRPLWGQVNNYFSELAGRPKPDSVYYLGGGGIGGPIVRNKTFFFVAAENYHDVQSRSVSTAFPTAAERRGDFSRLTNAAGQPVTIYDPLTRQPFPGNIIPADRINPVAAAITGYLPLPDVDVDNGTNNYTRTAEINNNFQQEYTFKAEHKFSDNVSLTGFYLYNRTDEPDANYFEVGLNGATRFADPNDYLLKRRPQILALNNTWVLSNDSVLALRYGWTSFVDNNTMTIDFDPAELGFSQTFLDQVDQTGGPKFPERLHYWLQRLRRDHSVIPHLQVLECQRELLEAGRPPYPQVRRRLPQDRRLPAQPGRFLRPFQFRQGVHVRDRSEQQQHHRRKRVRQLSPRLALGQRCPAKHDDADDAARHLHELFRRLRPGRLAGELAPDAELRPAPRTRRRHARGRQQLHRRIRPRSHERAVGVTIPADPVAGTPARQVSGGLMFAGVDGNDVAQGNQPALKWSPRAGVVYSLKPSTVLRAGYGLYWAPWNYPVPSSASSNYGQLGFTQNTVSPQTAGTPTVSLTNPFPEWTRESARKQPSRRSPASAHRSAMSIRTAPHRAFSSTPPASSRSCRATWP